MQCCQARRPAVRLYHRSAALSTTQTFSFQVNANAAPYASFTISCTATDASQNQSSAATLSMQAADIVPPIISSSSMANGATNVQAKPTVTITFSETLLASAVNGTTVTLTPEGGIPVAGTVYFVRRPKNDQLHAQQNLIKATTYRLVITTAVRTMRATLYRPTTHSTLLLMRSAGCCGHYTRKQRHQPSGQAGISVTFSEPLITSTVNAASVSLDFGRRVERLRAPYRCRATVRLSVSRLLRTSSRQRPIAWWSHRPSLTNRERRERKRRSHVHDGQYASCVSS